MPTGVSLPAQPDTLGALRAMQAILLSECLVGGVSPFAALSAADASRYGVANAIFLGLPKDFKDAYLPQCCLWLPQGSEAVALEGYAGRANAEFEARVRVFVDLRTDWYAAEQQILAIRDVLWSALLRHERLGGTVATVSASEARAGRGLCYEQVAGVEYRCYEALWLVRQQWSLTGGRVV
ncbi:MAG: hypothetical protein IVW57_10800 [Ktedonobacterales bacterium]|nr:hypothetical protein [Ktedonobacterales bacterium]